MQKLNTIDWIAVVLVIIGGLNWGLIGLFDLNLVDKIFGSIGWLASLIYILVGIAAIYLAVYANKLQKAQ